jgi:hypothetical protein
MCAEGGNLAINRAAPRVAVLAVGCRHVGYDWSWLSLVRKASGYESRQLQSTQSPKDPVDQAQMRVQFQDHVLIDRKK